MSEEFGTVTLRRKDMTEFRAAKVQDEIRTWLHALYSSYPSLQERFPNLDLRVVQLEDFLNDG
jgi:hypothetical protein